MLLLYKTVGRYVLLRESDQSMRNATRIILDQRVMSMLEQITRRRNAPQSLVKRAWVILEAAKGQMSNQIAGHIGIDSDTVGLWRRRWAEESSRIDAAIKSNCSDAQLLELILDILADKPRPGTPPVFTAEQVTQIVALACSPPRNCGVELSHWTPSALARESIRQKVVDSISPASVGRFLKRCGLKTPS